MSLLIWRAGDVLWGGKIATDVLSSAANIFNGLENTLSKEAVHNFISVFGGIAGSFLVVYFVWNLIMLSTREMLSLEKLIIEFIKLILAVALLTYLDEIISTIVSLASAVLNDIIDKKDTLLTGSEVEDYGLTFNFVSSGDSDIKWSGNNYPKWSEAKEVFDDHYSRGPLGIKGLLDALGLLVQSLLLNLVSVITQAMAYFQLVSCAIKIIARAIISPVAIVQVFDEGQRSSGVRYIKSFLAECFTMAGFVLILIAASSLEQTFASEAVSAMEGNYTAIGFDEMRELFTDWGYIAKMAVVSFASIGCMSAGGTLMKEVFGA